MSKKSDSSYVDHIWHFLVDDGLGIPFCAGIIKQDTGENISTQELRKIIKRYLKKITGIEPYSKCPLCGKALIPAEDIYRSKHVRCSNYTCNFIATRKNRFKSKEDYLEKINTEMQILKYVQTLPISIWYHLSNWADTNFSDYKNKRFLRDFALFVISKRYSHRQAKYALDLLKKAVSLGFDYHKLLTQRELYKMNSFQDHFSSHENNKLFQSFIYPIAGSVINGIEITETVVERLCYTNIQIKNFSSNMNFPFTETYTKKEWGFLIGVYKSCDKDYLIIHSNKLSDFIQLLEENKCETTIGPVLLNFEDAKRITTRLKNFNTNTKNKNYKILNFEQVISSITSFANNSINFSFCPLTSVNGFFLPSDQHIVVANNQTDFEIIFTLVHEITHSIIMSYSQDEIESSPSNWIEYTFSASEYLCNSVAMEVMLYLIDNSFIVSTGKTDTQITSEDIHKIFYKELLNLRVTDSVLTSTTPSIKTIINDCKNIITDMLISSIRKNFDSEHSAQIAYCNPNYDILPLDEQENKQLYVMISELLNLPNGFTTFI